MNKISKEFGSKVLDRLTGEVFFTESPELYGDSALYEVELDMCTAGIHVYTEENTAINAPGKRQCRTCRNARIKERNERR